MQTARVYEFQPADLIVDNVYLGPEGTTFNEEWLRSHGIGRVLTIAAFSDHLHRFEGIEYETIDVDDDPSESLRPHWERAFEFIDGAKASNTNILLHCVSGISRSGATMVAYVMKTRNLSFEAALALVRLKRPVVSPNGGFQRQLREYDVELQQMRTETVGQRHMYR